MSDCKIFPLRLPPNFHGAQTGKIKPSIIYKNKLQKSQNPQTRNTKISNWQRKIYNSDIQRQRKQFVVSTSKISQDTPNWFQNTHNYFRRNQMPRGTSLKYNDQKIYDVLNRQRTNMYKIHGDNLIRREIYDRKYSVTDKVGRDQSAKITLAMNQQISSKLGSLQKRNFDVRKPQLKIGKSSFVDTYTIF